MGPVTVDDAIRRLSAMRDLVAAGWSARDAARQVLDRTAASPPRPEPEGATGALDALARCAADFDALGLHRLLDDELAGSEPGEVVDTDPVAAPSSATG